jgi:hypothetical protein
LKTAGNGANRKPTKLVYMRIVLPPVVLGFCVAREKSSGEELKNSRAVDETEDAMSSAAVRRERRGEEFADAWPADEEEKGPGSDDGVDPEDGSELEYEEIPCTDDDSRWEAFIPDQDEFDPVPDPGDFWIEN